MKRCRRQKIKQEDQGEEHDLAYYIHDRVELMHQLFSILKPRDLKAMAPACVQGVSIDDLQELCTDELLGISSKRLCAILDGAEPPSDTESSSGSLDQVETISLDSISSDEEILSQSSSRKSIKHKHRKHSKRKKKDKSTENHKSKEKEGNKSPSMATKESRAGLTVLELLELQARARAIRAQLNKEKNLNQPSVPSEVTASIDSSSSGSEIEIKEEPAQVVEISSEDEKPGPEELRKYLNDFPASTSSCIVIGQNSHTSKDNESINSTRRVNDLIITVPRAKSSRKIKLNRHRNSEANKEKDKIDSNVTQKLVNIEEKDLTETSKASTNKTCNSTNKKDKKRKEKRKSKKQKDNTEKEGSDHDEITLQLSDTEKMDLLEDLDGNKGEVSSSSKDSESSSDDSSDNDCSKGNKVDQPPKSNTELVSIVTEEISVETVNKDSPVEETLKISDQSQDSNATVENSDTAISTTKIDSPTKENVEEKQNNDTETTSNDKEQSTDEIKPNETTEQITVNTEKSTCTVKDSEIVESDVEKQPILVPKKEIERLLVEEIGLNIESQLSITASSQDEPSVQQSSDIEPMDVDEVIPEDSIEISNIKDLSIVDTQVVNNSVENNSKNSGEISPKVVEVETALKETLHIVLAGDTRSVKNKQIARSENSQTDKRKKSEGEISDEASSEIEAIDVQQEIVCISDDENKEKPSKKKKKKDKKAKKEKKAKKSKSDFYEDSDHNFFSNKKIFVDNSTSSKNSDNSNLSDMNSKSSLSEQSRPIVIEDDDDNCEILELSDDSSCYEVEGVSMLSEEPTAEEIQALSSKIDEIEQLEVTEEQITEHENNLADKEQSESNIEDIENVSWKDRYLSSRKVKMVLSTSSIFNAMRKKNKELKKKIEMSKMEEEQRKQLIQEKTSEPTENSVPLEDGSIEQFNTLTGLTKYVDPVQENNDNIDSNVEGKGVSKDFKNEMKKDAKQLLKMYKRLLKYNDINKRKDPNKKKKKKSKKNKDKRKDVPSNSITTEL